MGGKIIYKIIYFNILWNYIAMTQGKNVGGIVIVMIIACNQNEIALG
jgi:hypothetical protein